MKTEQNATFEKILEEAVGRINKSVDSDITILLIGTYGRGTGCFDESGHPIQDIDFAIIFQDGIEHNLSKFKENLLASKTLHNLIIDLHFYTLTSLTDVLPLWKFYDLKYNSKLVFGRDVRNLICNFSVTDISTYDGLRMLAGELIKVIKRENVNNQKLYFVAQSAQNVKNGCYGRKIISSRSGMTLDDFADYALHYYEDGYKGSAKRHLQPTLNYVLRKKLSVNIKSSFLLSLVVQFAWTVLWALRIRNIRVMTDWRDPALRIYYSIIYYFSKNVSKQQKERLFRKVSFSGMKYSKEDLLKLHEQYFLGKRWKSIKRGTWSDMCKVIIP